MAQLTLDFAYHVGQIQLEKTVFRLSPDLEFTAVRGKTSGAYRSTGSFQWTPAVKAVCVLFLQALARSLREPQLTAPTMSGRRGSLASSLDYAIDKEPQWLCDMFGLDQSGKTNLRRLIFRTNPGSKRPGPVCLSLNESVVPTENIAVLLDSMPVKDQATIESIIAFLTTESPEPIRTQQGGSSDSSLLISAPFKPATLWKRGEEPIAELHKVVAHRSCIDNALGVLHGLDLPAAI